MYRKFYGVNAVLSLHLSWLYSRESAQNVFKNSPTVLFTSLFCLCYVECLPYIAIAVLILFPTVLLGSIDKAINILSEINQSVVYTLTVLLIYGIKQSIKDFTQCKSVMLAQPTMHLLCQNIWYKPLVISLKSDLAVS